jgi:LacI family transcriptional regulator
MLVLNSEGDPGLDARHLRLLERRRTDGLLVSLADEGHPDALAALRALSVPAVLIDRDVAEAPGMGAVLADHEGGMRTVVSHLVSLGHRAIGLAAGPAKVRPGREAARAFRECCSELGVTARVETGPFEASHGFDAASRMLDAPGAPTALIAGSNQIFPGVFLAVRERGLRIPQQLSLVTFDDQPLLGLLDPPIDVVRRGPQAFGQTAAELLLRQLGGERISSVLVPTIFEPRGSSAPPPPG